MKTTSHVRAERKPSRRLLEGLMKSVEANGPEPPDAEEVRAHVQGMSTRYWERVTETDLLWHLNTIHNFLRKLVGSDAAEAPVSVDWRRALGTDATQVIVCSWDRQGLLEKIAAAFSALRVGVQRADVYTRVDNLVLDVFEVCDPGGGPVKDENRLEGIPFLVDGAFSNPPRFASVWAAEFHKVLPRPDERRCQLRFSNRRPAGHTVLRVEADDRMGLLYDILHVLAEHRMRIIQATIDTRAGMARDEFSFTDDGGRPLTDAAGLRRLREALRRAILA